MFQFHSHAWLPRIGRNTCLEEKQNHLGIPTSHTIICRVDGPSLSLLLNSLNSDTWYVNQKSWQITKGKKENIPRDEAMSESWDNLKMISASNEIMYLNENVHKVTNLWLILSGYIRKHILKLVIGNQTCNILEIVSWRTDGTVGQLDGKSWNWYNPISFNLTLNSHNIVYGLDWPISQNK